MRLMVPSLLLPFTLCLGYRGACGANPFYLESIWKPFMTAGFSSLLNSLEVLQGCDRSSARNQSDAISFCAMDDPVFPERPCRFRTNSRIPRADHRTGETFKKEGI